jgi:hypothetical protein
MRCSLFHTKHQTAVSQHSTVRLSSCIRLFFYNDPRIIYGLNSKNMQLEEPKSRIDFATNQIK